MAGDGLRFARTFMMKKLQKRDEPLDRAGEQDGFIALRLLLSWLCG
jgi:hypothetical protein